MDSLSLTSTDIATAVRVLRAVGSATTEQLMDSSLKGLRRASLDLAKAAAQRMPKHVKAAYGLAEHDPAAVEKYRQEQWRKSRAGELVERIVDQFRALRTEDMTPGFHWDALAHNPG